MRLIVMILCLFAVMSADNRAHGADVVVPVSRVTTSFDLRYTEAVLEKVSHLLSDGFKTEQVRALLKEIDAMKTETPLARTFEVTYKGKSRQLQVRALLDDLGMIDLDFATDAELAAQIRQAVDGYLSRRN